MLSFSSESRLKVIFAKWIEMEYNDPSPIKERHLDGVQIECQVYRTEPQFIVSDGYFQVVCEFSERSLIEFKKYYPLRFIKDLRGCFIMLQDYAPHTFLDENKECNISLHIYRFMLFPTEILSERLIGRPTLLFTDIEFEKYAEVIRKLVLKRNLLLADKVDSIPPLENILHHKDVEPQKKSVFELEMERTKQAIATCKIKDDYGFKMVPYSKLEEIEKKSLKIASEELEEEKLQKKSKLAEIKRRLQALKYKRIEGKALAKMLAKKKSPALRSKPPSVAKPQTLTKSTFQTFLTWKNTSKEGSSNVGDMLSKSVARPMRVDFSTPKKPKKAFNSWVSTLSPRSCTLRSMGSLQTRKRPKI